MRLVAPLVVDYSASRRLIVDYFANAARPCASARRVAHLAARRRLLCLAQARRRLLRLVQAHCRLLRLHRASGCLGASRGSSRGSSHRSSSTTPPRAGLSSTTSPTPRDRVPQHVARLVASLVVDYSTSRRLVVDYFAYAARPGASARRTARRRLLRLRCASGCLGTSRRSSSTTSPPPRVRVLRHVAQLVARLVVDYFDYTARPGASACHAACRAGSSSTTSPTPRVWVFQHVTRLVVWLVVDYFEYATRPGASACHAARHAARRAARRCDNLPRIIPYYRLKNPLWSLSDNKVSSCR
jgi:hypothetical protein